MTELGPAVILFDLVQGWSLKLEVYFILLLNLGKWTMRILCGGWMCIGPCEASKYS